MKHLSVAANPIAESFTMRLGRAYTAERADQLRSWSRARPRQPTRSTPLMPA